MQLPKDDAILISILNMKLRDNYPTLSRLLDEEEWSEEEVLIRTASLGYRYDPALNRFTACK